jgi:hypothetical protein
MATFKSRTEIDETFRKLPDGSMEVVATKERVISAREVELSNARRIIRQLFQKESWTAADMRRIIHMLFWLVAREDAENE